MRDGKDGAMTTTQTRILIVEDDADIAALERDYLEVAGFQVAVERDGRAGLTRALSGSFDLVLLDVMLPGEDGMAVCRKLRAVSDIPILMVTARTSDIDKISGLGLGADDYIEKPFSPSVLVARVKAHLSRYERLRGYAQTALSVGQVFLDEATRQVVVAGKAVDLRNKEFELLWLFVSNPNVVFSREALYERIWGFDAPGDLSTVTVHIRRLRDKIEVDPGNPALIQTVRGVGYRFVSES